MPQRFLRPGIRNSARYNAVSMHAQSLWLRLLTLVDDFGRYDGRPSVLCGECFAVWNEMHPEDVVNTQRTTALCAQLADAKLVEFYESDGKVVVQMTQWSERARSDKSKWPGRGSNPQRNPAESCGILRSAAPDLSNNETGLCKQLSLQVAQESAAERSGTQRNPASLALVPSPSPSPLGPVGQLLAKSKNGNGKVGAPRLPSDLSNKDTEAAWALFVKHRTEIHKRVTPTSADQNFAKLREWGAPRWIAAVEHSVRNGWQGIFESKETGRPTRPAGPAYADGSQDI